ncbi:hypothetical protein EWP18_00005 [Neisseria meningitidis]|nr:hypothetical protein [Neisseria meningitidis]MBG8749075.1 hypothetical protein [Neisseria meningitidis]
MLPHTGLFLLGKVALQMRIRRHITISLETALSVRTRLQGGYMLLIDFYPFQAQGIAQHGNRACRHCRASDDGI